MPFIAGIAFSGLTAGSPVFTHLLSSDDPNFSCSSTTRLGENLEETVKEIATSFPEKPVVIKLALPSYLDNDTRKPILQAFKKAGLVFPALSENLQLGHISLVSEDCGPRNEILFHLAPTVAIGRLVSTTVEEGILESVILKETTLDPPSSDTKAIIAQFVDTSQATLNQQPSEAGTKLERMVAIDATITSTQVTRSIWKQGDAAAPIELTKIGFPSVALQAAKSTLSSYKSALEYPVLHSLAPVRIGIVKADGFVHSFIPRQAVLPQTQSATFTTSKDNQTKAKVSVVVGESPRGKDNLSVGQLFLHNLPARPAGVLAIRVTIDVDLEGNILTTAEEAESGVSEKTIVRNFLGEHHWDEVDEVLENFKLGSRDEDAEQAEKEWVGKDKQGALPE